MSEFSTAYQEFTTALASFEYAVSALEANTDPEEEEALINDVKDKANVLSALDQEVSNTLAQVQTSIFDETEPDEDSEETTTELLATLPLKLTTSSGNEHPRLAIDDKDNIWLAWHSRKTGSEEVYVAKYFGGCGVWGTSGQGGEEIKITNFGPEGKKATYPNVVAGPDGEVHVVFQGESEDGSWEVYYSRSSGGGKTFSVPTRITESPGHALMPDVVVFESEQDDLQGSSSNVVVVWHDDRFGAFEIMVAKKTNGSWDSSGQGGTDIRLTQSAGNSMFPRIDGDKRGNLRVVYHDSRRGEGQTGIYMSTFVSTTGSWDSSATGGSDRLVSNGPVDSLHPDIAIDHTGGISVAWHDLRHAQEDPDQHEEVYALYCPRMGHPGVHFPPLATNIEARLDMDFEIMDCVNFQTITMTNAPEVCLAIRAPNATFWRGANEDGQYSNWQEFRPNFDLETMTVPWTLICTGGRKQVCIQVQDAEMVGFPVCREVTLALQPPEFQVEFFEDEDMTTPLQSYQDRPVTKQGDVYVKLTTESPQILSPTFDVTSRGQYLIFNQETEALDLVSGFSGSAGIGSFIGGTIDLSQQNDVSPVAQAFSAAAGRVFKGRFNIRRHDGLLNVDGSARLIVKPRDVCGEVGASQSDQDVASGIWTIDPSNPTPPELPVSLPIGLPDPTIPPINEPEDEIPSGPCTGDTYSDYIEIGEEWNSETRSGAYVTQTVGLCGLLIKEGRQASYATSETHPGFGSARFLDQKYRGLFAIGEPFTLEKQSFLTELTLKLVFPETELLGFDIHDRTLVVEFHEMIDTYTSQLVPGSSMTIRGNEVAPSSEALDATGSFINNWPDTTKWTRTGLSINLCAGNHYLVLRNEEPYVGQPFAFYVGLADAADASLDEQMRHGTWIGPATRFGMPKVVAWTPWETGKRASWRDWMGRAQHGNKNFHVYTKMRFVG